MGNMKSLPAWKDTNPKNSINKHLQEMPYFSYLKHSAGASTLTYEDGSTALVDVFESEAEPQFNHVVLNGVPQIISSEWEMVSDDGATAAADVYKAAKGIA